LSAKRIAHRIRIHPRHPLGDEFIAVVAKGTESFTATKMIRRLTENTKTNISQVT